MDKFIELVESNLTEIISFALIAVTYMSQLIFGGKVKKTTLLTKALHKERFQQIDKENTKLQNALTAAETQIENIQTENAKLKKQLAKIESAIFTICGQPMPEDETPTLNQRFPFLNI